MSGRGGAKHLLRPFRSLILTYNAATLVPAFAWLRLATRQSWLTMLEENVRNFRKLAMKILAALIFCRGPTHVSYKLVSNILFFEIDLTEHSGVVGE